MRFINAISSDDRNREGSWDVIALAMKKAPQKEVQKYRKNPNFSR